MEHSNKLVLAPLNSEVDEITNSAQQNSTNIPNTTTPKRTRNKAHPLLEKFTKQLKIILKLAKIDAYDELLRIKNKDGSPVENSNILQLLAHSMTTGKLLIGEQTFIELLYRAKVEPELLFNENVKSKLMSLYNQIPIKDNEIYTKKSPSEFKETSSSEPIIRKVYKRKRNNLDNEELNTINSQDTVNSEEPEKKKLKDVIWIYPEDIPDIPDDESEWE